MISAPFLLCWCGDLHIAIHCAHASTDGLTEAHHKNMGRIPAELVVQTITSWKNAEGRVNGQGAYGKCFLGT